MLLRKFFPSLLAATCLLVAGASSAQEVSPLEQAFQKEFAFLETHKTELTKRVAAFKAEAEQQSGNVLKEIDLLESRLIELESRIDSLNDEVVRAEHQIEANEDNQSSLTSIYDQANATLADHDLNLKEESAYLEQDNEGRLAMIYSSAAALVKELSSVRKEDGQFFLADGTQVNGQLVKIGNIASFGISDMDSGALVPAGGGAMRLYEGDTAGVATALLAGESPDTLKIFLYESDAKGIDVAADKGMMDNINAGGIIGWVIVVLGLVGVLMAVLRAYYLKAASASTGEIQKEVSQLVSAGRVDKALKLCEQKKGSTARVVASTLRNIDRDRDHLEDIISESILHESAHLNRFATFIIVIAAVSPLLGLLGTVTGMIATFDVITEFGTGDPKMLSGGISTALVTTELGLIVAIPTLIIGNLLSGWSNRIKDDMEKAALRVTNLSQGGAAFLRAA